ncbi:hypothetical protein HW115_05315 [Verrucomicrobiaceae bacterium N1E253]|uniref:Uncharacterized protein n=1 Tax=Oceaniferula marina TaxID=2748318 RepID=A0A851GIR1_9BACT|nr:hypothetical protein [Oceaniferula marina]NWK55017.1 hypothetical protein [Oceaniferula marina]
MKDEITVVSAFEPSDALITLVDGMLDGQLSEAETAQLEQWLLADVQAQRYCADRLRFHAEIQEVVTPVRVEVLEKRHMVFQRVRGLPRFVSRVGRVVRIGNAATGKMLEIPPDLLEASILRKRLLWAAGIIVLLLALLLYGLLREMNAGSDLHVMDAPVLLVKNQDFEQTSLADDDDALSYTLLGWQDHFLSRDTKLCDLERFSDGRYQAKSGDHVALIQPKGYLTQLLMMSDGKALTAEKGMRMRLEGWALVDGERPVPLRAALRFVKNIKPEMKQYELWHQNIMIQTGGWQRLTVELQLPEDSLEFFPSDVDPGQTRGAKLDVTGKAVTFTLENRKGSSEVFVDDLSIHLVK